MKLKSNFKILYHYLKDEKFKVFLYFILVILTYVPALISSVLWGFALQHLIDMNYKMFFIFLAIWELTYILCYSLAAIPRDYIYNYLEIKFSKNVIKDLYCKTQELPAYAFEEMGVGEFINRMTTDPDRVMELLSKLVKMSCRFLVVFIVIIICFKTSLIIGLEIVVFAIIMGFISKKFFPKIKKTQENIKKLGDRYVKEATENLTGIREIKALGIKNNIKMRMNNNFDDYFMYQRKMRTYEIFYYNLNNLAYFTLQFIIIASCGYLFFKGQMSLALFVVVESYIWRIADVVESLSDFGINYNKVSVSLKRIDEIINNKLYKDEKFGHKTLNNIKGKIEFKNIKFRYKKDEEYVLKDLNLTLEPNKKIAIIGRSGNGKTTIFNLLLRYFDPSVGKILIDGINIKDLTEESLRNNISIIRQSPYLFNLSIMDNFRLIKEDVSLDEVRSVCKKAYIDEYIMSLPNGYDTIIGEGGVNLSGGQQQRIAIARTLLLNTKIILFDEATSALDNESQDYIKKTIDNLVIDHTIVIVAHRLSTIVDADIIHIIDNGKLIDSGTHLELMRKNNIYHSLYNIESN